MHLNIEHDETGQKFTTEVEGEEALLAYTMVNDCLNLHFMTAPNEEVAEELCAAAFEHARKNGLKIISSSEYVDGFILRHMEFADLAEGNF